MRILLGGGAGRGGGAEASAAHVGPHAHLQRVGGLAITLVQSARGGGTCSTHVQASTGWKDWASTPVHVSTGWRVRWVLRHCCQPPPRYQSRGYESVAIAAPGPQRMYRHWRTPRDVAALALLLHCCRPSPCYHRGAMGVHQPHSSCNASTAAVAARVSQQFSHCIRTAAKPAPLPTKGPRGCCKSRTLAAAHVLQLPQLVPCRTGGTATAQQPTPALLPTEGPRWGRGGGTGVGGALQRRVEGIVLHPRAHHHKAEGVLSTPGHASTGGQISTLVRVSTGCDGEVPSPEHISAVQRGSTRGEGGCSTA